MLFTEGFIFEKCMLTDGNVIGKRKEKRKKKGRERTRNFAQKGRIKFVISTQRVKFMNSLYQGNTSS